MSEEEKKRLQRLQYTMLIAGLVGALLGVYSTYLQIQKMQIETKKEL